MRITRSLLTIVIFTIAAAAPLYAQDKAAAIDELMKAYHNYGQFNGSVLVAENGKVVYKKGFGLANMEWNVANTPDTKFRLASITKQFTAAAILQLVEQGKIKLDGKVTDYLPDFRKDTGDRVTIHHLLNHTSGIPSYTDAPGFMVNESRNPAVVPEFIKKYSYGDLIFEPGSKFAYNNSGYFILGAIIEKISGKTYEQYIKDHIFTPLGMNNSGYDRHDRLIAKRAAGYQKTPDGYRPAPYLDMTVPYAAGSLYSTVEDLFLWDQAMYTDKVISEKSKQLMLTPGLDDYGYGFGIRKVSLAPNGTQLAEVSHTGGINGFSTYIVRLTDAKHTIILLDNTEGGRYQNGIKLNIARILYGQPVTAPKRSIAETLGTVARDKGAAAVIAQYRELKASKANEYDFSEGQLNEVGYVLLRGGKPADAIEIFKLNVELFPQASNPYDSLGEAYAVVGNKEEAIKNYKKALELDPKNTSAGPALKLLEAPAVAVDVKELDLYTGKYEVNPGMVMTITREGDKLYGQPGEQSKRLLEPLGASKFVVPTVGAEITFVKGENGQVTSLVMEQRGRKVEAKRLP